MDSVRTSAWLEWWANRSACLASFEVSVTISAVEHGWEAAGQLLRLEDHDDVTFFCEPDEVFDLRFPDDSTIAVAVTALTRDGTFTLAEARARPSPA